MIINVDISHSTLHSIGNARRACEDAINRGQCLENLSRGFNVITLYDLFKRMEKSYEQKDWEEKLHKQVKG